MERARDNQINYVTIVGAIILAVVVLVALLLRSCNTEVEEAEEAPSPYFAWSGFSSEGGRFSYTQGSTTASKTGIDVSENQGWMNWERIAADGIDFAIIRIGYRGTTEGSIYTDEYFSYNLSAAQEAKLDCGVYFFSQALNTEEAIEEAQFVLDTLNGTHLEYPVVFDFEMKASGIENRVENLSSEEATAIAQAFCNTIRAGGYSVMIYGNNYDLAHYNLDKFSHYPLWYAEYGALPSFSQGFAIWQYTGTGEVDGIDTNVDLNLDLSAVLPEMNSGETAA